MNKSKKRKNNFKEKKLECVCCGRTFDGDYKRKGEIEEHVGNNVLVKNVEAPENPFIAGSEMAKQTHSRTSIVIVRFYLFSQCNI